MKQQDRQEILALSIALKATMDKLLVKLDAVFDGEEEAYTFTPLEVSPPIRAGNANMYPGIPNFDLSGLEEQLSFTDMLNKVGATVPAAWAFDVWKKGDGKKTGDIGASGSSVPETPWPHAPKPAPRAVKPELTDNSWATPEIKPLKDVGTPYKDHEIRDCVSQLVLVARTFAETGQLRERLSQTLQQFLTRTPYERVADVLYGVDVTKFYADDQDEVDVLAERIRATDKEHGVRLLKTYRQRLRQEVVAELNGAKIKEDLKKNNTNNQAVLKQLMNTSAQLNAAPRAAHHIWPGPGPEPIRWTACDGAVIFRDRMAAD